MGNDQITVASKINNKLVDDSIEAMNRVLRKEHVLLGGDKNKD